MPTYPGRLLLLGSIGEPVRLVQQRLNVRIDGIFNNATRDAVITFQRMHGLTPDGDNVIMGLYQKSQQ